MAQRPTAVACLALLLASAASARRARLAAPHEQLLELSRESLATLPVRRFAGDCWQRRSPVRLALAGKAAHVAARLPGAGMDPKGLQPFTTVLKDGYFEIACAKDYLLAHGDKFGDGKDSYMLGEVSNVSVVHYTDIVAKEDREAMTQEVCFKFCRTVPDMLTFGIHNGRDCYCAPYFKPMESDSTACDAVCEGSPTQMCGGKFKSSVFEMHQCADTAAELKETGEKAASVAAVLGQSATDLETLAQGMQATAAGLQKPLGAVGDEAATGLMQEAKKLAGELEGAVKAGRKVESALSGASTEAASLVGGGISNSLDVVSKAEALTRRMEKLTADAEDEIEGLDARLRAASPSGPEFNTSTGAAKLYYPLMYFVDKAYSEVPSTCGGEEAAPPVAEVTLDECAHACDAEIHSCVGFAFFSGSPSLCFRFSKFTTATYYTGCSGSSFLQRRAPGGGPIMACMAKLSKFDGTSIKPDPSGKCDGCLKKASKAARCP